MLENLCNVFVYSVLGLSQDSHLAQALSFFLYDSIKIIFLLFFMIAIIGFLRTFISLKKSEKWLVEKKYLSHFIASMFGAITPFCSCSSIPIFLSFVRTNVPLGVTFSFLITSPLINEYLVVLMLGFFGWKITVMYVISGMAIGVISGLVMDTMKLEKYIEKDIISKSDTADNHELTVSGFGDRVKFGINEATSIVKKLWMWILIGVGVGAAIHNYVPQEAFESVIGKAGVFSVPIATIISVPIYGSCAAIVPIAVALFNKGLPLGTALAFMMAISALSFPEAVILRRAMKLQLILIFFGITSLGIIFTGYLFNYLQTILV